MFCTFIIYNDVIVTGRAGRDIVLMVRMTAAAVIYCSRPECLSVTVSKRRERAIVAGLAWVACRASRGPWPDRRVWAAARLSVKLLSKNSRASPRH